MYILFLVPILIILPIAGIVLLYFKKKNVAWILFWLFVVVNWLTQSIPLFPSFHSSKTNKLSVESFNIHSSGDDFKNRQKMIAQQILQKKPSFVYLTEYIGISDTWLDSILKKNYRYSAASFTKYLESERFYSDWHIDSVFNLSIDTLDAKVLKFSHGIPAIKTHLNRIWVYRVQIHEGSDVVAIYCCHLDTNNFGSVRDSISGTGIGLLRHWKRFLNATEIGYVVRELESDAIVKCLKTEKYPYIVMGDLNDISGSYTIRNLQSAGMKDAWWEKGFGYGCTFHDHGLRLRIDHILYDYKRLKLNKVEVLKANLSDHNAMTASFSFK